MAFHQNEKFLQERKKKKSVFNDGVLKLWKLCHLSYNKAAYTEVLIAVGIIK